MRKILWTIFGLWLCGLLPLAHAESFGLADGSSLTADIVSYTDAGVTFRQPDDTYTNLAWTKFSQDGLKQLAQHPKIKPFVEPFVEIPLSERQQKPEVTVQPVSRLELPSKASLFGSLFSSPVGIFLLLLFYAANLYAGYEVAVCRSKPVALVVGLAVVLPVVGPVIFLSLPKPIEPTAMETLIAGAEVPAAGEAVAAPESPPQEEIHIVSASWQLATAKTPPQIFQRGQFTFNRRFFETRFPGFFGSLRNENDRNKELVLKVANGEYIIERITSVAANDISFETLQGEAKQAVTLAFGDIQEIKLITKDA